MATMTLNLSDKEMAVVDELAAQHEMTKTAVIRQALRLYQMVDTRLRAGERMMFSGDKERTIEFIGLGWYEDQPTAANGELAKIFKGSD